MTLQIDIMIWILFGFRPVHGLIFLFKWIGPSTAEEAKGNLVQDSRLEKIFFAKQVIQNACATQVSEIGTVL